MSTEENKAVIQKLFDAFNRWDLDGVERCLSPNFIRHSAGMPDMDLKGYKQLLMGTGPARCTIDDMVAEGDKVAFRNTFRFVHKTPLFGIPPTGKEIAMTEYYFSRVQAGRVIEWSCLFDMAGLMQQLGMAPPAG